MRRSDSSSSSTKEPGDAAITAERLDDITWVAERWEL